MPDPHPADAQVNLKALAALSVFDSEGDPIALGSLWQNQRAVLAFLPPLTSLAAEARAKQVGEHLQALRGRGAEVFLLGPSLVMGAVQFEARVAPRCEIYVDPERLIYRAAGLSKAEKPKTKTTLFMRSMKNLLGVSSEDIREGIERIKWALDTDAPNELYIGERRLVRDWS